MGMNFKIFNDKETASEFVGDITRKQVHQNPTSAMLLEASESLIPAYRNFIKSAEKYPADFSQVKIGSVNKETDLSFLKDLNIPSHQLYLNGNKENLSNLLKGEVQGKDSDDKKKEKNKTLNYAVLSIGVNNEVGFINDDNDELLDAREIILVGLGVDKAEAVYNLYNAVENDGSDFGDIKNHRMVTVVLDQDAASKLDRDFVNYYSYKFA